jgi:hypothetical protein
MIMNCLNSSKLTSSSSSSLLSYLGLLSSALDMSIYIAVVSVVRSAFDRELEDG